MGKKIGSTLGKIGGFISGGLSFGPLGSLVGADLGEKIGGAVASGDLSSLTEDRATEESRVNLISESGLSLQAGGIINRQLSGLEGDLRTFNQQNVGFQSQIQNIINNQGLPTQTQIAASQNAAQNLFAPERVALQQAFETQRMQAGSQAANLGRSSIDPVLQAQLRRGQAQQESLLNARQTSAAQELSLQSTQNLFSSIDAASQLQQRALANRAALLEQGSNVRNLEQNFRLAASGKTTTATTNPSLISTFGAVASGVGSFIGGGK